MKEISRTGAEGAARGTKAAGKAGKKGKESTLKNTVSCIDNPDHFSKKTPGLPTTLKT
jgi:hypothetical protein